MNVFKIFRDFFNSLRFYTHFSLLNVFGMATAFLSAYIILLQVDFNLTYNNTLVDTDCTFRLEIKNNAEEVMAYSYFAAISDGLGQMLGEDELVESFGRMNFYYTPINLHVTAEGETQPVQIHESWGTYQTAQTMGFKLLTGDFSRLEEMNTIILCKSFCDNHNVKVDDVLFDGRRMLTVVGIFEDFPRNCMFHGLNMFIGDPPQSDDFVNGNYNYFYRLHDEKQKELFLDNCYRKLVMLALKGSTDDSAVIDSLVNYSKQNNELRLTPLSEIYTTNDVGNVQNATVNADTNWLLLAIAIVIVAIAFVNFFNFYMALVPRRIRRVNIERIFGASLSSLRISLFLEALGIVMLAMVVALSAVALLSDDIDSFNYFSTSIALNENIPFVLKYIGLILLLAVLTVVYPVWYMTSQPTAMSVNISFAGSQSMRMLRNALLGLQFAISMILIIYTLFIRKQYDYMMTYDTGFNKQHLFVTNINSTNNPNATRMNIYDALTASPLIDDVAFASGRFVDIARMTWTRNVKGEDKKITFPVFSVSWNFLRFMGIEVYEGRDFEESDEQCLNGTVIFNESLHKASGITLDSRIVGHTDDCMNIVGFCKDVNHRPLHSKQGSFAFYIYGANAWQSNNWIYVRTIPEADITAALAFIREQLGKIYPDIDTSQLGVVPFDNELKRLYKHEQVMLTVLSIFSVISIIISLLGVFGLVLMEVQYRRREIALRRVNGATIGDVLYMLVLQYLKVVAVSVLFAFPVGYIIVDRWLQTFAYKVPVYPGEFVVALLFVVGVTSLVVVATAWHTVRRNPVDVLKKY
ncbi:MAG: FtsX-like permease family protein [Bacteroidaceae bacterium]|nr:FtsX-like permease family protein [Bacteroidaceae bacterium]